MPTFEVRCDTCLDLKWPTLPERPKSYECVLCRMLDPAKRARLREGYRKGMETRRRKAASSAPDRPGDTIDPLAMVE